jgi:hypothetical protein
MENSNREGEDYMEIIISILFIIGVWAYCRHQESKASNYSNTYKVDWSKVNQDRIKGVSEMQLNKNIYNGQYGSGKLETPNEIRARQNAAWEKYKKDNPWMPLN